MWGKSASIFVIQQLQLLIYAHLSSKCRFSSIRLRNARLLPMSSFFKNELSWRISYTALESKIMNQIGAYPVKSLADVILCLLSMFFQEWKQLLPVNLPTGFDREVFEAVTRPLPSWLFLQDVLRDYKKGGKILKYWNFNDWILKYCW